MIMVKHAEAEIPGIKQTASEDDVLGGRCHKTGPTKRECSHDQIHSVEELAA